MNKNASVFVGKHYLLSERQRLALVRSMATDEAVAFRKAKEKARLEPGSDVYIDCFNTVISLEIAFSDSTLLLCMDGTIRDVDRSLYGRDNVITSDAVILDHCRSLV